MGKHKHKKHKSKSKETKHTSHLKHKRWVDIAVFIILSVKDSRGAGFAALLVGIFFTRTFRGCSI